MPSLKNILFYINFIWKIYIYKMNKFSDDIIRNMDIVIPETWNRIYNHKIIIEI